KASAFRCADWFNSSNPECYGGLSVGREEVLADRQEVMVRLEALSARYPRLLVWDPFDILCPSSPCRAISPSGPLFFDNDHLSNFANRLLVPSFLSAIEPALAGSDGSGLPDGSRHGSLR